MGSGRKWWLLLLRSGRAPMPTNLLYLVRCAHSERSLWDRNTTASGPLTLSLARAKGAAGRIRMGNGVVEGRGRGTEERNGGEERRRGMEERTGERFRVSYGDLERSGVGR